MEKPKQRELKMVSSNGQTNTRRHLIFYNAHLTSAPVLGYPYFSHPFDIETDASLQGLGAVLSQKDEPG